MDIYLIRHTTPAIEKGVIYGQMDVDVNSDFKNEALTIQQNIPVKVDAIYSSPLQRCTKLAHFLFKKSIIKDPRLKEVNFGNWEGLNWDDIKKEELNNWMENFVSVAPPLGESMEEMLIRVQSFWKELLASNHSSVAIVTHAGVIRLISSIISGTDLKDLFNLKIEYGDVFFVNSNTSSWAHLS
ncbi:MAG: alpha-ribazole phosphatase [Balneolaceae bacterium]